MARLCDGAAGIDADGVLVATDVTIPKCPPSDSVTSNVLIIRLDEGDDDVPLDVGADEANWTVFVPADDDVDDGASTACILPVSSPQMMELLSGATERDEMHPGRRRDSAGSLRFVKDQKFSSPSVDAVTKPACGSC